MNKLKIGHFVLMILSVVSMSYNGIAAADDHATLKGINFPGPAIAGHVYPGTINKNYHFPSATDVKTYAESGFDMIRLAITWERLQPELGQPFATDYLRRVQDFVQEAAKHDLRVVIDVHNYGKYKGQLIGTDAVTTEDFEKLWYGLAEHFRDDRHVLFGLMNEPNKQDAMTWSVIAQEAVNAIREANASQTILVPATFYSSAARWLHKDGYYSNGEALKKIDDPKNNMVFEAHQYLDKYSTGTEADCVSADIGVQRLTAFTGWLKENGYKGFLGEFAAGASETCQQALKNMLDYIEANEEVWYGWTYWVADPWFRDYIFNIYPPDPQQFPQVGILKQFIN
ncbi:glycoside hydrolase family 5 protein [Methylophaga sp.]|uniref:glycoside hydrolase family 5 protein n=1 Tax=Methylophaga sp. TaxID=2024840 RepID=UPI0013FF4C3F|nr:glycoside hydrolase family 5 protein [Methylophaga sp.]MTI62579.1 glycoside hydrolase family 5 protein [Methylophaga sp.]